LKRRDLIRHIEKHGCEYFKGGSKSYSLCKSQREKVSTIPGLRKIDENLAKKICKDLGIPKP